MLNCRGLKDREIKRERERDPARATCGELERVSFSHSPLLRIGPRSQADGETADVPGCVFSAFDFFLIKSLKYSEDDRTLFIANRMFDKLSVSAEEEPSRWNRQPHGSQHGGFRCHVQTMRFLSWCLTWLLLTLPSPRCVNDSETRASDTFV